ncbi:MAG: toll/interleukin-1 receptor domain-containing protein [Erysipelotrichaceae bacterium]|nr:toll/interleukin-1 receptor domain-containing protein [Erysipelotrichaceae bacterium]
MSEIHYDAFISYRHTERDIEIAKEIQHQLEHFHIPKAIREKYKVEKISRLFRDQEELTLNADLAKNIQDALNNSDYLIIICSPQYNESKWCLLEVENFLKNHDRDHVLCVLSEGEPPSIFPDTLCHYTEEYIDEKGKKKKREVNAEPLACDYRGDKKDARRIELPRLAAAMIGCSYDELVLRQEKYRRKRLFTILSIVAVLATVAITYLLWSNAQISKNYRQALINESKVLAKESLDYYKNQDRYNALKSALDALPEENNDRPIIDEAIYALNEASYAYKVPYNTEESWRIDIGNDINDFFISTDTKYAVVLDKTGIVHTYQISDHKELTSFRMSDIEIPVKIHEGSTHRVVAYVENSIICFDYLKGEKLWQTGLKYGIIGNSVLSHNCRYIGASDSYAIQVMDTDGNPKLSLPMPDQNLGYFTEFIWSADDNMLAGKIRLDNGEGYSVGIFDFNTSDFYQPDCHYLNLMYYDFDSANNLYILGNDEGTSSSVSPSFDTNINTEYELNAYSKEEKLFTYRFYSSSIIDEIKILETQDDKLCLVFGNEFIILNRNGEYEKTYKVNSPVSAVIGNKDNYAIVVCKNGYDGTIWFEDGNSSMSKMFPADYSDVKLVPGSNFISSSYAFLKDGNILFYEDLFDENIEIIEDQCFYYPPYEYLQNDELAVFKADQIISFIVMKDKTAKVSYPLDEDKYYHLLTIIDDYTYVMEIDAEGSMSVLTIENKSGRLIDRTALGVQDSNSFFSSIYYSTYYMKTVYLDYFYQYPSCMAVSGNRLFIHDLTEGTDIVEYDLLSREIKKHRFDLKNQYFIDFNGGIYLPSEIISDGDNKLLSVVYTLEGNSFTNKKTVLLDLSDDSYKILENVMGENFCGIMADDKIIYSGNDKLYICDKDGNLQDSIYYTSDSVRALALHKGKLYCVYPDGELKIFDGNKEIRSIQTAFEESIYPSDKGFNFNFYDDELFFSYGDQLHIINLNSDSGRPLCTIESSYMAYDRKNQNFIIYSYNPENFNTLYYPALIKRHTLDELIERAKLQLDTYK